MTATEKMCRKCRTRLPLEDFYADKGGKDGRLNACKRCLRRIQKQRYRENAGGYRDRMLARASARGAEVRRPGRMRAQYGLTAGEFASLLESQGGVCAICRKPPSGRWRRLFVDHDHHTGAVRGFLCSRCNLGIGHFYDDASLLTDAARYLQKGLR